MPSPLAKGLLFVCHRVRVGVTALPSPIYVPAIVLGKLDRGCVTTEKKKKKVWTYLSDLYHRMQNTRG
jgi:hypothetical protein